MQENKRAAPLAELIQVNNYKAVLSYVCSLVHLSKDTSRFVTALSVSINGMETTAPSFQ
jgi:hypothetical protein